MSLGPIEATLKKSAAALERRGVPFLLGGGLACWARGGPESSHDLDLMVRRQDAERDRKSTRLNSSHTEIYTLSLHDALPISRRPVPARRRAGVLGPRRAGVEPRPRPDGAQAGRGARSEEHTSELQSHRDLHSFPTRRSSDLAASRSCSAEGWRAGPAAGRSRATTST